MPPEVYAETTLSSILMPILSGDTMMGMLNAYPIIIRTFVIILAIDIAL